MIHAFSATRIKIYSVWRSHGYYPETVIFLFIHPIISGRELIDEFSKHRFWRRLFLESDTGLFDAICYLVFTVVRTICCISILMLDQQPSLPFIAFQLYQSKFSS